VLSAIPGAEIVVADSPGGVVGWSRHHTDLVSVLREPDCHLAGIFAYSREFGRIVEPIDQDSQTLPFTGSDAACQPL
jgi:hypothetical protein